MEFRRAFLLPFILSKYFQSLGFGFIFNSMKWQSLGVKVEFKINPIKPTMSHEEKVYEYARRLSYYSLLASKERKLSKVFKCQNILRNLDISGKSCGCFSNEIMFSESRGNAGRSTDPCKPCIEANVHYSRYRDAKSKQGAAMRQLNKEMNK